MLQLSHVLTFVTVVDAGGFRSAAASLHLSQPAITRQMDQLESGLGVRLLDRGPAGTQLTPAGARFVEHARALLLMEDQAREAARAERPRGTCRIGVVEVALAQLTGPVLRGLRQRLPGVRFFVVSMGLLGYDGTVPPDLDLVIAREPWRAGTGTRIDVLFSDPVIAAAGVHSAFAETDVMTAQEVLQQPALRFGRGAWAEVPDYWSLSAHGRPKLLVGSPIQRTQDAAQGVRSTRGCACGPLSAVTLAPMRALSGPMATAQISDVAPNRAGLMSRAEDRRPLVREVRRQVRRLVAELGPILLPDGVAVVGVDGQPAIRR